MDWLTDLSDVVKERGAVEAGPQLQDVSPGQEAGQHHQSEHISNGLFIDNW